MRELLTTNPEELQRRLDVLNKSYKPKIVFMEDGKLIAGENISRGDLVYFQSSISKVKTNE